MIQNSTGVTAYRDRSENGALTTCACAFRAPACASACSRVPKPCRSLPFGGADTQEFLSIDDIAPPIVHELQWRLGNPIDMEPRDHDWQETDLIVMDEPSCSFRRFVQGGRDGTRWYVWHERGGMAHSHHIAIFDLPKGGTTPHLLIHTWVMKPDQLCPKTKAHLHGSAATPEHGLRW